MKGISKDMFTGIIEEIGRIKRLIRKGKGLLLEVQADALSQKAKPGDSFAVNGVCLTAMEIGKNSLSFYVSEESLSRANLSKLRVGEEVNIESALTFGKQLGGHLVQGHIDGRGKINRIFKRGGEFRIVIAVDRELLPYVVPKGSVAVDGISLTVANVRRNSFEVVVVPYTYQNTNLKCRRVGDLVNIEVDILSKYALQGKRYG